MERETKAMGPKESAPPSVTKPCRAAAGVEAVLQSGRKTLAQMDAARGAKLWLAVNQTDGFDCPGCAWPDPDERRARFEFCENGAKAIAEEATERRIGAAFFAQHSVEELSEWSDFELGQAGRLTEPMVLRDGASHYAPIGWDAAFERIAERLCALDSPDEAVFYTSGRTSNEAAFLYQLLARKFGTNNLPDCSNMCHESSGAALTESIGIGKGTVSLHDIEEHADLLVLIGQNPGTNHPRMLSSLQKAKRRGAKIIAVNPLPEAGLLRFKYPQEMAGVIGDGTPLADLFLPVRINGDIAAFKGIARALLDAEETAPGTVFDHAFLETFTVGADEFLADVRAATWAEIVRGSGCDEALLREAAALWRESRATICCWAMGLTQHENAVGTIQTITNVLLLRGDIGKAGAGVCPVRGHSNVQGDRTMGIWEKMPDTFLDKLGDVFGFSPPRAHGVDTVDAIRSMRDGRSHVFFAMGGNFLAAAPDTNATARAMRNCALTVHVSTKLNRSHLVTGETALILPCLGRTERDVQAGGEQFVSVENSMGVVHNSRGQLQPASALLKSEVAIVCGLASAVLGEDWSEYAANYDRIREKIAQVVPGFTHFNEKVRRPGGFYLPNAAKQRDFHTGSGRAQFFVHPIPDWDLPDGQLLLMTIRSHDQFNTTIYGLDDRYRGIHGGRRVVFVNDADVRALGFVEREKVDIVSDYDGVERVAEGFWIVSYPIRRGCAAAYFPETNVLAPLKRTAKKSNTPISKSIVVRLRRSAS